MTILYFARLRDEVGCSEEKLDLPENVTSVQELIAWLQSRSEGHSLALGSCARVKVAVNQEYADPETPVGPQDEVAFFPPVTGG